MDGNLIKAEKDEFVRSPTISAINGKIILASVIILFVAIIIVAFFHIYAGLFLHRRNRHHQPRGRRANNYFASSDVISQGLEPSILETISTFRFSCKSKTNDHESSLLECAVCLSEFEHDEMGRVLPKCNHCFHVQCIDIWFQFHSNCPVCRTPVQAIQNLDEFARLEGGLSSVLNSMSQRVEDQMVCSTSICDDEKLRS